MENKRGVHPLGKWAINLPKKYPRLYSGPLRGVYVHRAVWEQIAKSGPLPMPNLPPDFHVHHQDFDRMHFCGANLIAMPKEFNPGNTRRHPYTGKFMKADEWQRWNEKL